MTQYSVVIPAFNSTRTIAATIRSVLEQSVPAGEILVVDDGSSDDLVGVLADLDGPIRLLPQENQGPGRATFYGMEEAQFELVATLDADDLWVKDKMERQIALLDQMGGQVALFCHIESFADEAYADSLAGHPEIGLVKEGWIRSTMCLPTAMALQNGPLIDDESRCGELIDWLARLRESGQQLHMMPDVLSRRRVHPTSLSFKRSDNLHHGYLAMARRAILRKRALKTKEAEQQAAPTQVPADGKGAEE